MKKRFDLSLFIACLTGGIVGSILAGIFYNHTNEEWNSVLVVGIYFAIVTFCITLLGVVSEMCTNHLNGRNMTRDNFLRTTGLLLVTPIAFFVVGDIFQFIYGLGETEQIAMDAKEFIVMIDNSGSTAGTDPQQERFSSVVQFVENMNLGSSIMITIFSDDAELVFPMTQKYQGMEKDVEVVLSRYSADGGTNMQGALEISLCNYRASSDKAVAMLFSDGESSIDVNGITQAYQDVEVPIFTISFAGTASGGRRLLKKLADKSDGAYLEIGEGLGFLDSYQKVQNYEVKRILLDSRIYRETGKIGYTILRIILLTILVAALGPVLAILLDSEEILRKNTLLRIGLGLLSGLVMEFGFRAYFSGGFLRWILCVLMSLVFVDYVLPDYGIATIPSYEFGSVVGGGTGARTQRSVGGNTISGTRKNRDKYEFKIGDHSDRFGKR